MKQFYLLFSVLILTSCAINISGIKKQNGIPGKSGDEIQMENQKKREAADKKLADSLGGDAMGMKTYMLVILKTGPKDSKITDEKQRSELFKGHFSSMETMQKAGKLKMAGPFATKNQLQYRGLFLLDVKTEAEAKELVEKDPTVAAGIFTYEILPWMGSAALPMHLNYHKRIEQKKQ